MTVLSTLGQTLVLTMLPHGGQRGARRNACAGVSSETARVRARREAEVALGAANTRQNAGALLATARNAALGS